MNYIELLQYNAMTLHQGPEVHQTASPGWLDCFHVFFFVELYFWLKKSYYAIIFR